MKRLYYIFFLLFVTSSIFANNTINLKKILNSESDVQEIQITYSNDGLIKSVISDFINIQIEHIDGIYYFDFANNTNNWQQKMIQKDQKWEWYNGDKLICNIFFSDKTNKITSDSKNYTINIYIKDDYININLGKGRVCSLNCSKNNYKFNSDREISSISLKNNSFTFTDYFDYWNTTYMITNPIPKLQLSKIAFLIPVLFHLDSCYYPFLMGYPNLDYSYHATSYLTEGTTTYEPEHLQQKDGLPWASGNGKGIGDVISITDFEHKKPSKIIIMNGYQDSKHPEYYENNSRIKKIKITNKDTKKTKIYEIKDIKEEQSFEISELESGNNYDIEVLEVYNGKKYTDLCIQYMVLE